MDAADAPAIQKHHERQTEVFTSKISELSKSYEKQIEQLKNQMADLETKLDGLLTNNTQPAAGDLPVTSHKKKLATKQANNVVKWLLSKCESFVDDDDHEQYSLPSGEWYQQYNELRLEKEICHSAKRNTKVKLFCAVVGVGSVFPVDIDISETVGDLKKKIKGENPNLIHFDAALLKLYLAKRGSSWLNIGSDDIKAVQRGETPDTIKVLMKERMAETRKLENRAYLGTRFVTVEDDIHILVELPAEPDQVVKYNQQGGLLGSFVGNVFSLQLPWSYLQSLFVIDKASQTKKDA